MIMARSLDDMLSSISDASQWKLDQEIDFDHRDERGQVIPQHLGRIAESMVDWEGVIADHLGLSEPDRSDIREKNPREPKLQRREALGMWKSRLGSGATYRALIEVFFKAGRLDYAEFVCCGLLNDIGTRRVHKNLSDECTRFITSMKGKYQERRINREKQWPPCHSNKLVRLELVERGKGEGYSANAQRGKEDKDFKRTFLAYDDLFKVESGKRPIRKVLVEGDAGIGKTTLCISISEDWANGKLFQQFELVLLLPLRMKIVESVGSLSELLKLLDPCFSQMLCDSVARYFEGIEKKTVLIIADGWDELSESQRQEGSFLYQLLFNSTISIVVTSRPSASASLRKLPDIDRFVEVSGFSKQHIVEYIQTEFTSDPEKAGYLLEQLGYNPLIESVCSVPLNCAIVCHLWRSLEEALPTTITELYTKIILNLVLRNVQKHDTYTSILSLSKFDSLPAELQKSWWLLCKFAFEALEKDQLVFSQEELEAFFPEGLASDKRILCFGLLQSAESILVTGYGVSFHFLHLTFQEYLAALHLARQSPDIQLMLFQSHTVCYYNTRFSMVWKFFCGIFFCEHRMGNHIKQIVQYVGDTIYGHRGCLSLCHCAFEAQSKLFSNEVCQFLIDHPTGMPNLRIDFGNPSVAYDCAAVLHIISHMWQGDDIGINFGNCGIRESQIKHLTDILASKNGKLLVSRLNLSGSRLTTFGLQTLENAVYSELFPKLVELKLVGSLSCDADINAAWLTTSGEALSAYCPHLVELDLSDNNLGVPGALAFGRALRKSLLYHCSLETKRFLSKINLKNTNLGDEGLSVFVTNLEGVHNLGDMNFASNNIHASGISCLADAVSSRKIAIKNCSSRFDLSDNPLGLEGTVALGTILSNSNCCFHSFDISRCGLTKAVPKKDPLNHGNISCVAVGQQLCQMPQCRTVGLYLNGNSFTGDGIHILAGFMHMCPNLIEIDTNDCEVTSDDLIQLLDKFIQLKIKFSFLSWHLHCNAIDDIGMSALIDHLPLLFPCCPLYEFHVTNNPISSKMVKRLKNGAWRFANEKAHKRLPKQEGKRRQVLTPHKERLSRHRRVKGEGYERNRRKNGRERPQKEIGRSYQGDRGTKERKDRKYSYQEEERRKLQPRAERYANEKAHRRKEGRRRHGLKPHKEGLSRHQRVKDESCETDRRKKGREKPQKEIRRSSHGDGRTKERKDRKHSYREEERRKLQLQEEKRKKLPEKVERSSQEDWRMKEKRKLRHARI